MESKNNIDKLFKDKLSNREFDIKESFLADLEGRLYAQKPKKKLKPCWRKRKSRESLPKNRLSAKKSRPMN